MTTHTLTSHARNRSPGRTRPRRGQGIVVALLGWLWAAATPAAIAHEPFVDVTARYLPTIKAGAAVTSKVEGWSHLLLFSQPKLAHGDVEALNALSRGMAERFPLTLAADIRRSEATGKFYLRSLGAGFAARSGDGYRIISSDDAGGMQLGLIERMVLSRNEAQLKKVVQIARTLNMAIFDANTVVYHENEHRDWTVRHALLIDPENGQPSLIMWFLSPDDSNADTGNPPAFQLPQAKARLIPAGFKESREIHVDQRHFAVGLPTERAFAMLRLPEGTPLEIPDSLRPLVAAPRLVAEQVPELENGLREWLANAEAK